MGQLQVGDKMPCDALQPEGEVAEIMIFVPAGIPLTVYVPAPPLIIPEDAVTVATLQVKLTE